MRALRIERQRAGRSRGQPGWRASRDSAEPGGQGGEDGEGNCQREHSGWRLSTCCGSVEICDARFDVLYFQFGQAGHGVQAVSRLIPCGGPCAGAGRCGPGGGRVRTLSGLGVGACEKDSGAACRALHVEHHRAGRTRKRPGRCASRGSSGPVGTWWREMRRELSERTLGPAWR